LFYLDTANKVLSYPESVLPSEGEPRKIGQALSKVVKARLHRRPKGIGAVDECPRGRRALQGPAISVEGLLEAAKPAMTREDTTR
jgi:hypothetical protein